MFGERNTILQFKSKARNVSLYTYLFLKLSKSSHDSPKTQTPPPYQITNLSTTRNISKYLRT